MECRLAIRAWSAWAPGLQTASDWQVWAHAPMLPSGDGAPNLFEVPALQRRRLSRLGRATLHATFAVHDGSAGVPMVFCSRYGDVERSLAAIEGCAVGGDLSPTTFAMSVHNAIGAMASILRKDLNAMTCIAAGAHTAAAGLMEAAAMLADGAEQVLMTCYDEPLPAPYEVYADTPQALYAWAWRLARAEPGSTSVHLRCRSHADTDADAGSAALPADLRVLQRFLIGGTLIQRGAGQNWHWHFDRSAA